MCGILGIISRSGSPRSLSREEVVAMRDTMSDRGPDAEGYWEYENFILAHRRLAIRDLDASPQPMVTADGRYAIVYNGEIYNDDEIRDELKRQGERFQTACDTEVVLKAWARWQEDALSRFRGMFAFGIVDTQLNRWWIVRDRCGVKPLFYSRIGSSFVFASSLEPILHHPRFSRAPNFASIRHYLATLRLTLGNQTMFEGIQTLEPGHLIQGRDAAFRLVRYWSPSVAREEDISYEDAVERLQHELRHAVSIRLKSDVPVGMMLSGGVDSNTLATFAKEESGNSMVGCCGGGRQDNIPDDTNSDFVHAQQAASRLGFDYREVCLSGDDYLDTWTELLERYPTPLSTPTDVVIYRVAQQLKQEVGVALGGEGADEAFCGYSVPHWSGADLQRAIGLPNMTSRYTGAMRESLIRQYGRDRFRSPADHYLQTNGLIPGDVQQAYFKEPIWEQADADQAVEKYYDSLFGAPSDHGAPSDPSMVERYAHVLFRLNLESLLGRLDSATMSASLEARVPFTDHKVVELAFSLPHHFKIDVSPSERKPWLSSMELFQRGSLRAKRILRSLASRFMPATAAARPKVSFGTPLAAWLHNDWGELISARIRQSPFLTSILQPTTLPQLNTLPAGLAMWKWPIVNLAVWGDRWFGEL